MSTPPKSPIIVAIDVPTLEDMQDLLKRLDPQLCQIKIGHILFTRYGPRVVEEAISQGYAVFLDLKFHDIPETVKGACRAIADMGVWMFNVHIQGGRTMLEAAAEAFSSLKHPLSRPLLLGVTILTSLDQQDLEILGIRESLSSAVMRMAGLAKSAGLDGVVCSAEEAHSLRQRYGRDFILVTPGIRLAENQKQDQKRIMTPELALAAGSDYLVIGRPITQATDPLSVLQHVTHSL